MVGCRGGATPNPNAPRPRIVTFAPSLTDIVFDMGLGDHVVGVTTQCQLPPGQTRLVVGDALSPPSTEAILSARPDVILTQVDPSQFQTVRKVNPSVRIEHFRIETLEDISSAVERIGRIVGQEELGKQVAAAFRSRLEEVRRRVAGLPRPRVLFVMDYHNPSTAGAGTFIDQMIETAGGVNAAAEKLSSWQSLNQETILSLRPDVLVCWVGPNEEKAARDYWARSLPRVRVFVVTERDWTIPTPRLASYVARLAEMIHPSAAARGGPSP
jgi:iron complex transport system substrate-binding protein